MPITICVGPNLFFRQSSGGNCFRLFQFYDRLAGIQYYWSCSFMAAFDFMVSGAFKRKNDFLANQLLSSGLDFIFVSRPFSRLGNDLALQPYLLSLA